MVTKDLTEQKIKELDAMIHYVKNFFIMVNIVILYSVICLVFHTLSTLKSALLTLNVGCEGLNCKYVVGPLLKLTFPLAIDIVVTVVAES